MALKEDSTARRYHHHHIIIIIITWWLKKCSNVSSTLAKIFKKCANVFVFVLFCIVLPLTCVIRTFLTISEHWKVKIYWKFDVISPNVVWNKIFYFSPYLLTFSFSKNYIFTTAKNMYALGFLHAPDGVF